MKNTNLDEIKDNTKAVARCVTPSLVDGIPLLASHPFLESNIWGERLCSLSQGLLNVTDGDKLLDEFDLTNPKTYEEWCKEFDKRVDKCSTLYELYMLYRDPYKLTFMKFNGDFMSNRDFANFLADAWVTEENPNMDMNVSRRESISYFRKAVKCYLMTNEDYTYYHNLPDEFDVYRGVGKRRIELGLSWTDCREKAEWFMNRWNGKAGEEKKLLKAHIKRENVLAYFNTRGEREIVTDVFAIKDKIERII